MNANVEIVIPTAGRAERSDSLQRAVDSVLNQHGARCRLIIVFNGPNVDEALFERFSGQERIAVHRLAQGNLPNAILHGRNAVSAPFFGFLDDDDCLTANSVHCRLQPMLDDAQLDAVIGNGWNVNGEHREPRYRDFASRAYDPQAKLVFEYNWLASCGGLYRSARIDASYFAHRQKYFEWTMTAYLLCQDRRVQLLDEFTFEVTYTEDSLSNSGEGRFANAAFLRRVAQFPMPREQRAHLKRRIAHADFRLAEYYLSVGQRVESLRHYARALNGLHALKYLAFVRKYFLPQG